MPSWYSAPSRKSRQKMIGKGVWVYPKTARKRKRK